MKTSQAYAVNEPLTTWANSWYQHASQANADLAEFIAPCVQAPMQGEYSKFSRADGFLLIDSAAPAHTPARLIDIEGEKVAFSLRKHALKIGITDEESARAGGTLEIVRRNKVAKLIGDMRRAHLNSVFKIVGGIEATAKNYTVADGRPIADLTAAIQNFTLANGIKPNRMVVSQQAWNTICATEEVKSELAYNRTRRLTPELLAEAVGYSASDTFQVRICTIPYNTEKGNATATNKDMMGDDLLLFYADDMPNTDDITPIKTLCYNGTDYIGNVETKYDDDLDAEYSRVKSYNLPVLATDAIVRWTITCEEEEETDDSSSSSGSSSSESGSDSGSDTTP